MSHLRFRRKQQGFTMIELMIAMMVFSVILVVVTAGILNFSKQYYKGVIANQTQNTTRTIIDDVSRAIQFNSGSVYELPKNDPLGPTGVFGYCLGESRRYSFLLNRQVSRASTLGPLQSRYGLTSDTVSGCTTATLAVNTANSSAGSGKVNFRELLGENMRLNKFKITQADGLYTVTVKVIYGDNDLLCSPSVAGSCNPDAPTVTAHLANEDVKCRLTAGSQFCAVSELSTTVKKRVQ